MIGHQPCTFPNCRDLHCQKSAGPMSCMTNSARRACRIPGQDSLVSKRKVGALKFSFDVPLPCRVRPGQPLIGLILHLVVQAFQCEAFEADCKREWRQATDTYVVAAYRCPGAGKNSCTGSRGRQREVVGKQRDIPALPFSNFLRDL